jgi:gliding motility-associated-like protein
MRKQILTIVLVLITAWAIAQKPVIENVEPLNTYPLEQVLITGSGFTSTIGNLQVWFGQVRGTILNASDFTITVVVPPQAKLENIEVINLASNLSGKATTKFMPSYSGTEFTAANLANPVTFTGNSTHTLFDICTCDLNADGKPDIIATKDNDLASDLVIFRNDATPRSITGTSFTSFDKNSIAALGVNAQTSHVICGDLDNDGKPDLVAVKGGAEPNRIFTLRNTSSPALSFVAGPTLLMEGTDRAWRVAMADFNGDGRKDLVVTNTLTNVATNVYVFENLSTPGTIAFGSPQKIAVGVETYGVDLQDFDGDGKIDIVTTRFNSAGLYFLRNTSSGTISFATPPYVLAAAGTFNSVTSADFNNDGRLDVAVSDLLNAKVTVYFNQSTPGTMSFRPTPLVLTAINRPVGIDVADVNGDGYPDIVASIINQATVNVFLHNKNFTTPGFTRLDIPVSKASRTVRVGDLDGDAKPDLVISSSTAAAPFTIEIIRNTNCHKPVILNALPLAICEAAQTIDLRTINAPSVTSYQWIKDGGVVATNISPTFSISAAGSYAVRGISESGACTGALALSEPVPVLSGSANIGTPVITTNPANSQVCAGGTLVLSTASVSGASYVWGGPNNFTATTAVPNVSIPNMQQVNSGYYTLQVVVGNCSKTAEQKLVQVVNLQSFTVTASPSASFCQGGNTTLSVSAGYTYQWYKNDVPIAVGGTSNTYAATESGNYKVKISNGSCDNTTDPIAVKALQPATANFNAPTEACTFQPVSFTNQTTGVDANGSVQYLWEFGNGQTSTETNPTHSYQSAGSFTLKLTVSYVGVTGCSHTFTRAAPLVVTASTQPTITVDPNVTSMCPGDNVTLTVLGTFTSVTWSPGGSTNTSIQITQPGTYTVNTVAANGCTGQSQKLISSKPVPTLEVIASTTQIQRGQSVQLQALGADTYAWTPADGLSDPTIANPVATPNATTEYTVTGTVTGQCSAQASIKITVGGSFSIDAPLVFSPNGDGVNETWVIPGLEEFGDCTMSIFDGRGRRIFQQKGYTEPWNGTYNGKQVPAGTYYYVFGCPTEKPATGSVLIVR